MKKSEFEAIRAYQHFLFYIEVDHIRAYSPWGDHLTRHFLEKLSDFIHRTGSGYARIDAIVKWVQEMTPDNLAKLMEYVMFHHLGGWTDIPGFKRVNPAKIKVLNSVGAGIDPEGNCYPMYKDGSFDLENGTHITETEIPEWFNELSEDDLQTCKEIAQRNRINWDQMIENLK